MNEPGTGIARSAQILRFLLKYRSAGVFTGLDLDAAGLDEDVPPPSEGRPEEFVADLEALGPAFVKIGQALSTRPDMVPAPYIAALERMQDEVAPVPFDVIRVVAVKVQRPGVADAIRCDLDALASVAGRADRMTDLGRRVHFADWVHEFRKTLLAELDYHAEAENLVRFAMHFRDYPELYVPAPVWDYTRARVLTMDLVTGTKVTELSGLRRTEQRLDRLAASLMRGYLDQVFVYGEIHADPHPGNLLVTDDNRIALFDMGMVAHVPPRQRERLLKLLFAAVDGRGEEVANEAINLGTRLEDFDTERFMREVGYMVARYAAHTAQQGRSEGRLMLELVRLSTACGLRTPPELSLLGKTLLTLEQVASLLDPDIDMKGIVEDHLEHVMRQRLRRSLSPSNLAAELIEVQSLLREAP